MVQLSALEVSHFMCYTNLQIYDLLTYLLLVFNALFSSERASVTS